jgi:hypothetical protein
MEAGNHPAASADVRAAQIAVAEETLLAQIAYRNQPAAHPN